MSKYAQLVRHSIKNPVQDTFSEAKHDYQIKNQNILNGYYGSQKKKKIDQKKLTNDQIIQEKTKSTNCLFNQHIGKKSVLNQHILATSIKFTTNHQ